MPAGILISWFGGTVGTVVKPLCDMFIQHAAYLFTTGRNLRDLETATLTLDATRNDLQHQIEDDERRRGFVATAEAITWLQVSGTAVSQGRATIERYQQRCRVFRSCSPDCCSIYQISKKAAETLLAAKKGISSRPQNVTVDPPPPSVVHMHVQSVLLPSQEHIQHDVLQCIDDEAVGMIGICGPHGVGKSLLLKMINNSFYGGDSPFDIVIYLTASRQCSVQHVQSEIVQRLKMQAGESGTLNTTRIYDFLLDKSFLVLLDDLWDGLNLEEVGIPYPLGTQGQFKRKVVITTRSKASCQLMNVDKAIIVLGLEKNEALQLFQEHVGMENLYSDPHIGTLAIDLVEEIRGLPSELIGIGKAMRRQGDPGRWKAVTLVVKQLVQEKDDFLSLTGEIVRKLEEGIENLHGRSNDVRRQIELAKRNGMVSTDRINIWLERVDTITPKMKIICESYQYELNLDISASAAEKLCELQEHLNGQPNEITVEAFPPSVQELPCLSTEHQPSRVVLLQEALQYIRNDPVGVIGIWGLGGVGKTHLLREINNSFIGDSFFNHVIFVTASKECSVAKIQDEIVKKLKLPKDDDVEFQAKIISNFLQRRSIMILLDDLWDRVDLQAVGIPCPLGSANQPKRKVILTTRSRKVCGLMEVRKEIKVNCLQGNEAWKLFEQKVSQEALSSCPLVGDLARELVNELKGLPLALITIGRAMYAKTDLSEWESAIHYMKQSCCDDDDQNLSMEDKVFRRLKFSYDSLKNKTLRQCFLTCSLWPEDEIITVDTLLQCWMGLGLVNETDINISYNKVHSLIGELKASCLIESGGSTNYVSVKMHDVVRDMAIWISCGCGENNGKWVVRAGVGADSSRNNIHWSRAECVSLMQNNMRKHICTWTKRNSLMLFFHNNSCSTKLRTLFLQHNDLDERILEAIVSFAALTYLDLSYNNIKKIPEELLDLDNLEYLNLSGNTGIDEVPVHLGKLVKLKFLYLNDTSVKMIPKELISSLEALQVLDLRTNNKFGITAIFGELCTLTNLKSVNVNICSVAEFELVSKSTDIPFRCLRIYNLEEISELCLSGSTCSVDNERTLYELDISSSSIKRIKLNNELQKPFSALRILRLRNLRVFEDIIMWKGISSQCLFPKLNCLVLHCCTELQHISWAMYLPCLEYLDVTCCNNMKQAFLCMENYAVEMQRGQESSKSSIGTFTCLKDLRFINNTKLNSLCDADVAFPSLETLDISYCPMLKSLPFTMQNLPRKLHKIQMENFMQWDTLEWEDGVVKSFLQPLLNFRPQ